MSTCQDCHWTDFDSSSGSSDVWVTAYVLARLAQIPAAYVAPAKRRKVQESLEWLLANRNVDGGWGYNTKSQSDADSTAWAILALRRLKRDVPESALEIVRRCRRPDGGFALLPESAAGEPICKASSSEITALAINALGAPDAAATEFLVSHFPAPASGMESPLYICSAILDWENEQHRAMLSRLSELISSLEGQDAFEEALLLRCLTHLGIQKVWSVAAALRRRQLPDGSWPVSELAHAGRMIRQDSKRIVTSITAISALATAESQPGLYFGSDRPAPQRLNLRQS